MLKFSSAVDKNYYVEKNEKSFGSMLNYTYHFNDTTILTKDNEFISVIKINGFPFETADDQELENKKQMRNNLFKSLEGEDLCLWFHTIRRKQSEFPEGEFDNIFTNNLNKIWKDKQEKEKTFVNEHYITIIKKGRKDNNIIDFSKIIEKFFNKNKTKKAVDNKFIKESYSSLTEIRERILTSFNSYGVKLLGVREDKYGRFSEICEFLGKIANLCYDQKMKLPSSNISHYINTQRLYFDNDSIEMLGDNCHKFAGIVSLKEYRPGTFAGMLDSFLKLPFELIISQSFYFTDRSTAISKMQLQQRRLMQAEDLAVSQISEIDEALEMSMSGKFGFGSHHLSVMCITEEQNMLQNAISQVIVTFSNIGLRPVKESLNLEATFWGQFPANGKYLIRKSTINTLNLSSFCSFHNYPVGKIKGNHWGDATTIMNTMGGSSFYFSFHTRDVGHTAILGPTGGGKTVLLNFLAAQAQKFKPKLFFFDKDRGAELFIRSVRGDYTVINPGYRCNFNPLFLDDNPENRNFLVEWLKVLVSTNGEKVTAEEVQILTAAIDGCYRLPKKKRILRNIAAFLGMEQGNNIAVRLKMWYNEGSKAKVFDNEEDMLDFSKNRTFGFDMAEIMKDKVALTPVLLYIFHKINLSLDGSPTMVIMDEAWALIDNPVFAPKIKDWLKVMRKLNAIVIFATQSVEDAAKSPISDTLVEQTATQIFLGNLKAGPSYKSTFMLSEREFQLIKTSDPSSRYFLLKQDSVGTMARIDLSAVGDLIHILSGRIDLVNLCAKIREDYGNDPQIWLPLFFERIKLSKK